MKFLFPKPGTLLANVYNRDYVILVLSILPRRGRPRNKCLALASNKIQVMDLIEGKWVVVSKLEDKL